MRRGGRTNLTLRLQSSIFRTMGLEKFLNSCDALLEELSAVVDARLLDRVVSARDRLRKERLNILVVGEFSRGKSTFINALVGEPILPAKVNPTTATINILTGGHPRSGKVEYHDGTTKDFELPLDQVNKYLDQIVTITNADANRIRTVQLQVPGRLEQLLVDIIDTPGVNDMNSAREEVTFSYLRNADAAVLLLDAQQPLSESERTFLREKVFGNDINRVLFVINKIDEVLTGGSREDIPRIIEYVRKRLEDMLELKAPRVYAVSAKNALRARYKKEPDAGPTSFEAFERELISFAAEQAQGGRLAAHVERVQRLVGEQRNLLEAEAAALAAELGDLGRALGDVEARSQQLERVRAQVQTRVTRDAQRLGEAISAAAQREVEALKRATTADISACRDEDDMERLRAGLSQRLRGLAETVESTARQEREKLLAELEADFGEYLASGSSLALVARGRDVAAVEVRQPTTVRRAQEGGFDFQETVAGVGLGYLGASLFGPIGIAAAVMGSYLMSKSRKEKQQAEIARQEREEMVSALNDACARLTERARGLAADVSKNEAAGLERQVLDRMSRGVDALSAAADTMRRARQQTREEREAARAEVARRAQAVESVEQRVQILMERMRAQAI